MFLIKDSIKIVTHHTQQIVSWLWWNLFFI